MSRTDELAFERARVDLPPIPGDSPVEQLINGRGMAEEAIREYVGTLRFEEINADAVSSEIRAWEMNNEDRLAEIFADSGQEVIPDDMRLELGATLMQQWIIYQFTLAAEGMGPWTSGEVHRIAADPTDPMINELWALEDLEMRLLIFRSIIQMRNGGDLEQIFRPQRSSEELVVSGVVIPIWAYLVALAIIGALVVVGITLNAPLKRNNDLMREMCINAQKAGNDKVVIHCIESLKDLQKKGGIQPIVDEAGKVIMVLGGGYLLIRYGLPWIADYLSGRKGKV